MQPVKHASLGKERRLRRIHVFRRPRLWIEHPSGQVDVLLQTKGKGADMDVVAGTLRTARPIMKGEVLVPRKVFASSEAGRKDSE